jgi:4-hydroxythreonine-4-phosphate dehydrogenase
VTTPRPLVLTPGEPAGIGVEIACKAWLARTEAEVPPFILIADPGHVDAEARRLGAHVPIATIAGPAEVGERFAACLPVLAQELAAPVAPGCPDSRNATSVISAIERAVRLVLDGEAAAVVTNPIHKQTLYEAGFAYPGHTEFLAALAGGGARAVMMLCCPGLRVVPVTVHLSLRNAIDMLRGEDIVQAGRETGRALETYFGISRPRLAVAALNPHGGESGSLGREEIDVIAPAVHALRGQGIDAWGPAPADTLFHAAARAGYDAVLCMYHDQALIPLKTIDFDGGVNVTLGLPFVRTSPDHGTAFDIAGRGMANPRSLIEALKLAAAMAERARGSEDA